MLSLEKYEHYSEHYYQYIYDGELYEVKCLALDRLDQVCVVFAKESSKNYGLTKLKRFNEVFTAVHVKEGRWTPNTDFKYIS